MRLRELRDGQDGAVTLWVLGLVLLILTLGALSLDLWRIVSERRALVGVADAAAYAAASGIDEAVFRAEGSVVLDPGRAVRLGEAALAAQHDPTGFSGGEVLVERTRRAVTVRVAGTADTLLLGLLDPGLDPAVITVTARAEPHLS